MSKATMRAVVPATTTLWSLLLSSPILPSGWLRTDDLASLALGFELAGEVAVADDQSAALLWWNETRQVFMGRDGGQMRQVVREAMEIALRESFGFTPAELLAVSARARRRASSSPSMARGLT